MAGSASRTARASASASPAGEALQLKIWLMGVSPTIWRRLQVPPEMTLRGLHGALQVATGWEGLHLYQFVLRGKRHGSWELSAASPDVALEELRLCRRARFVHEYDLNAPWRHELRLEDRVAGQPRRSCPFCAGATRRARPRRSGARRAIRSGARRGCRARRWRISSLRTDLRFEDLAGMLKAVVLDGRHELLDEERREAMRDILDACGCARSGGTCPSRGRP